MSRKFLLLVLDTLVSLLTFFVGKYATPATAQDLLFIVGALQPVFVAVILGIAIEDAGQGFGATTAATKVEIARIEAAAVVSAASVTASPKLATPALTAEVPVTPTEKAAAVKVAAGESK